MKKYKIGIALGGGGARGFAHLGVLKALEEKGIQPDIISGVSAGALVGVFIASGMKPDDIFTMMKENKFNDYAQVIVPKNGLLSLDRTRELLKKHLSVDDFADLKIPLYVATTNLFEGKIEYFNKGDLTTIIQASMSIPVLFSPVKIGQSLYADGGIMDNLPVEPLIGKCRKIIAVNISPLQTILKIQNLIDAATRAFQLSVNATTKGIDGKCDILIEPEKLSKFELLNTSHVDEMFEIGYEYCKNLKIAL
ncbi:MAG: patatin-like phospholipase family protein [Bacteroidales bacterium]|nr:patatin-like phospholipase family protein [Bacteroidales bacterium]